MQKQKLIALKLTFVVLASGCASVSSPQPVAVECPKPPVPPAWMMEPVPPSFTQRLLQILPPLQETQTSVPSP